MLEPPHDIPELCEEFDLEDDWESKKNPIEDLSAISVCEFCGTVSGAGIRCPGCNHDWPHYRLMHRIKVLERLLESRPDPGPAGAPAKPNAGLAERVDAWLKWVKVASKPDAGSGDDVKEFDDFDHWHLIDGIALILEKLKGN